MSLSHQLESQAGRKFMWWEPKRKSQTCTVGFSEGLRLELNCSGRGRVLGVCKSLQLLCSLPSLRTMVAGAFHSHRCTAPKSSGRGRTGTLGVQASGPCLVRSRGHTICSPSAPQHPAAASDLGVCERSSPLSLAGIRQLVLRDPGPVGLHVSLSGASAQTPGGSWCYSGGLGVSGVFL